MKLKDQLVEMEELAAKMYSHLAAVQPRNDARFSAQHIQSELKRLRNFINGRPAKAEAGTKGQPAQPALGEIELNDPVPEVLPMSPGEMNIEQLERVLADLRTQQSAMQVTESGPPPDGTSPEALSVPAHS